MTGEKRRILNAVSAASGVTPASILGRDRCKSHVFARHAFWYLILQQIKGQRVNRLANIIGVDHSSVNWAVAQVRSDLESGGPRAAILHAAVALLATTRHPVPHGPVLVPETIGSVTTRIPERARSVTRSGYVDEDGNIVCHP